MFGPVGINGGWQALAGVGFDLSHFQNIGLAKTRLQHILTAAAINLERIYAWLEGVPLAQTRISHFKKMAKPHLAIA